MSAHEKREKTKSIASTTRATQPVCSISVLSCPANSKNAVNGIVSPSESRSKAPTGNVAHAQNAVKRLRARRCLIVPGRCNTSYYDVLWKNQVVWRSLRARLVLRRHFAGGFQGSRKGTEQARRRRHEPANRRTEVILKMRQRLL